MPGAARPHLALAVCAAALALAACGAAASTAPVATPAGPIAHPRGATDIVVQVALGDGLAPSEDNQAVLPPFTLYGDGTVYAPDPATDADPDAPLRLVRVGRIDEQQVQAILARAASAGLLVAAAPAYGDIGVADGALVSVSLAAGGVAVRHSALALGMEDASAVRLPAEQAAARAALRAFVGALPVGAAAIPYAPTAYRAYVSPLAAPEAGRPALPWPLASDVARDGTPVSAGPTRCIDVAGPDAATLAAALLDASSATPWAAPGGGATFRLVARALLPGEPGCAAAMAATLG